MTSKTIVVTGGNSGIGFGVAKSLCKDGHEVIIACRSEQRGKEAVGKILKANGDAKIMNMKLDLADLDSVRSFVDEFKKLGKPLDVLLNNAGLILDENSKRQTTKNNFELSMGTNHLGPFLLTNLLLDDLKTRASEVGEARIVNVSSTQHDPIYMSQHGFGKPLREMDVDDFFLEKPGAYQGYQAYKESKLAQTMMGYVLARKLEGTGVTVNSLCPGVITSTNAGRDLGMMKMLMLKTVGHLMFKYHGVGVSLQEGIRRVRGLAVDENLKGVTGKYYQEGKEKRSSNESYDDEKQKAVWELSARYCQLEGYEPLYCKEKEEKKN